MEELGSGVSGVWGEVSVFRGRYMRHFSCTPILSLRRRFHERSSVMCVG